MRRAAGRADAVDNGIDPFPTQVSDGDLGALVGEQEGGGPAHTGCGPGDDDDLVGHGAAEGRDAIGHEASEASVVSRNSR